LAGVIVYRQILIATTALLTEFVINRSNGELSYRAATTTGHELSIK
jgi:hypothetical protein